MQEIISQADLARLLDCPRSRVSQLVSDGMPKRPDGKLNRGDVLKWLTHYKSGHGGGWWGNNRGKKSIPDRARAILNGNQTTDKAATSKKILDVPESPPAPEASATDAAALAYIQGGCDVAHRLCFNFRLILTEVFQKIDLRAINEAGELEFRVMLGALVGFLAEGWCEEFLCDGERLGFTKPLPEPPWNAIFGADAEDAQRKWIEWRAYWTAGTGKRSAAPRKKR